MAKLTKAQRLSVEQALSNLSRAMDYVFSDKVAIAVRDTNPTNALHFTRQPVPEVLQRPTDRALGNYALYEVAKDIGSDLCGLQDARRALERLLS